MLHRTCWSWLRRHPLTSWSIIGVLLAALPPAYVVFVREAHRYVPLIPGNQVIAGVIDTQYEWIEGNLLLFALCIIACMIVGASVTVGSAICGAMNAIWPYVASDHRGED